MDKVESSTILELHFQYLSILTAVIIVDKAAGSYCPLSKKHTLSKSAMEAN